MSKRILVALDPSPYTNAATAFGCHIAKQFQAEIGGLVVLDEPGIEKSIGAIPLGAMHYAEKRMAQLQDTVQEHISELVDKFRSACDAEGVPHVETERVGTPGDCIVREAKYFDCLVLGLRTFFQYGTGAGEDQVYGTHDDESANSLDEVMDNSVTPIFAVPMDWKPAEDSIKTMIAFDGSLPAVRALHSFAKLFPATLASPTLLNSNEDEDEGNYHLTRAAEYLKAHGFNNIETVQTKEKIISAVTGSRYEEADLIVVGAHTKPAILDFLLGDVCKELIKKGRRTLLIAN